MKKILLILCFVALTIFLFAACNSNREMEGSVATEYPLPTTTPSIIVAPSQELSPAPSSTLEPTSEPAQFYFPCIESCSIAKDFLGQYPFELWDEDTGSFLFSDAALIYTMYRLWGNPGYWDFRASGFRVYGIDGSYEPLIINMQYWAYGTCSTLGSMLYIKDGNEFRRLGSMIYYATSGGYARFQPFINEYGDVIVYVLAMRDKLFYAVNSEGNFAVVGDPIDAWWSQEEIIIIDRETGYSIYFTQDEFDKILATGQMQQFFSDFPDGNFVPLIRMYDLEQHLKEAATQILRDTFSATPKTPFLGLT